MNQENLECGRRAVRFTSTEGHFTTSCKPWRNSDELPPSEACLTNYKNPHKIAYRLDNTSFPLGEGLRKVSGGNHESAFNANIQLSCSFAKYPVTVERFNRPINTSAIGV